MGKHFSIHPSLAIDPDVIDLPPSSSHLLHPFPHTCPVNNRNHTVILCQPLQWLQRCYQRQTSAMCCALGVCLEGKKPEDSAKVSSKAGLIPISHNTQKNPSLISFPLLFSTLPTLQAHTLFCYFLSQLFPTDTSQGCLHWGGESHPAPPSALTVQSETFSNWLTNLLIKESII